MPADRRLQPPPGSAGPGQAAGRAAGGRRGSRGAGGAAGSSADRCGAEALSVAPGKCLDRLKNKPVPSLNAEALPPLPE